MTPQVALVTGGASGIGAATVAALQREGVRVAVLDLAAAPAADWSRQVDVTDLAAVRSAVADVTTVLGEIDLLVTAAGVLRPGTIENLDVEEWRAMLAIHVVGTATVWHAVLPHMVARGRGAVCAIGSELGLIGDPTAVHYAAAKGAVHALVKSVAVELAPHGVRVNAVAPGPTDTPLLYEDVNAAAYADTLPLGRILTPDEIAAAVCFTLLEASNLVGQVVSPNAGAVL